MSCAGASLAKTLVPQGKALALMASEAAYGERWHASFAKYDPATHLWKTPQCSLLGDYIEFSETWPKWGMMQNGVCSERVTPELTTSAIASGSWPTPCTRDYKGANGPDGLTRNDGKSRMDQLPNQVAYGGKSTQATKTKVNMTLNPSWVEWLMGWPIGWTDLKPLETDKLRNVQLWHFQSYQEETVKCL